MYQEGGGDGLLATLPQAEQATCFPANYAHVAASVSPGLAGPRSCWILIEQRLNPVMVLLKQRPDLPESTPDLSQGGQVPGQSILGYGYAEAADALRSCGPIVLSCGSTGHSEHQHNPIRESDGSISHGQHLLDAILVEALI